MPDHGLLRGEICLFYVPNRYLLGRLEGVLGAVPMAIASLLTGSVARNLHARRAMDADANNSRQMDYDSCGGLSPAAVGDGRGRMAEPANAQTIRITGVAEPIGRSDPFSKDRRPAMLDEVTTVNIASISCCGIGRQTAADSDFFQKAAIQDFGALAGFLK